MSEEEIKPWLEKAVDWIWDKAPLWRRYTVVGLASLLLGVFVTTCGYAETPPNAARLKRAGVALEPCPDRIAVPGGPTAVTGAVNEPLELQERLTVAEADERCYRKGRLCKEAK